MTMTMERLRATLKRKKLKLEIQIAPGVNFKGAVNRAKFLAATERLPGSTEINVMVLSSSIVIHSVYTLTQECIPG